MNYRTDGELVFLDFEMHKRDLMRQAKIERLAREAEAKPSQVRRGWMRLIADLMDSAVKAKSGPSMAQLSDGSAPIGSQDNGFETI